MTPRHSTAPSPAPELKKQNPPTRAPLTIAAVAAIAAIAVGALALLLLVAAAWAESAGWPFLAAPLERQLTRAALREVRFSDSSPQAAATAVGPEKNIAAFSIRFLGGVSLRAPALTVAAPPWSQAPHTFSARNIALDLRYADLWRAYRGGAIRVQGLQASSLDAQLERLADGRASWQFRDRLSPAAVDRPLVLPSFGSLQIGSGSLSLNDVPLALNIQCDLTWTPLQLAVDGKPALPAGLSVQAKGKYKNFPLTAQLATSAFVPALSDARLEPGTTPSTSTRLPIRLSATVGRAKLSFEGSSATAFSLGGLAGQFDLSGPSLAAVGDPVGVTLPTTGAFRSRGRIVKEGLRSPPSSRQTDAWRVVVDDAMVGSSRLNGAFTYETVVGVRRLSGRLGGSRLLLSDLGPAIGGMPGGMPGGVPGAADGIKPAVASKGKVLPSRPFDLKALRAMDANVLIDISDVDLNTNLLEPLRPLRAHLQLASGVLTLSDLEARTAQGELRGLVRLDGRNTPALWNVNLRWNDVRLERWIKQVRANDAPPWVSGRLNGVAVLQGQGRSTAEILATLKGKLRTELQGGSVSHLAIEAAGLDVAQGLGMLIKGDDALPVQCGVADLVAEAGSFRPRVMVIDTKDSAVWVDGSLSLATETLDLRAVVLPKDFSPLALRSPLLLKGSFAKPEVSVEKAPLARKLGLSVLLGLLNPVAALIPLIDPGNGKAAADLAEAGGGCASFAKRARDASNLRRP
jgi:AsmA family protein